MKKRSQSIGFISVFLLVQTPTNRATLPVHNYLPQINDQDVIKLNKCRAKEYLLEFQYASTKTELYFNATGHMAISSSNEKTPFLNCIIWSVLTQVPSGNTNNGYKKTTCIQNIKK